MAYISTKVQRDADQGKVRMGQSFGGFSREERGGNLRAKQGVQAKGTYLGEPVADLVTLDERDRVAWNTHYRDIHAPLPHVYDTNKNARRGVSVAGDATSPYNLTYEEKMVRGADSRISAQKEYWGSTLDLVHRPGLEGPGAFSQSSQAIGNGIPKTDWMFRPHFGAKTPSSMAKSQSMHEDFMERFCPSPYSNSRPSTSVSKKHGGPPEYPEGNNNRTAWPRTLSQVGGIVFKSRQTSNGTPLMKKVNQRVVPDTGPKLNQHFRTTKGLLDDSTVRQAWTDGLYHTQDDHVSQRTVSADAPPWFQIPGVNVGKLNADQLRMMMEWKAPIPKVSMDASLRTNVEGATDRARMYAKHQTCPMYCSHAGCAQAKIVIKEKMRQSKRLAKRSPKHDMSMYTAPLAPDSPFALHPPSSQTLNKTYSNSKPPHSSMQGQHGGLSIRGSMPSMLQAQTMMPSMDSDRSALAIHERKGCAPTSKPFGEEQYSYAIDDY